MSDMKTTLVIMAAGMGSRYGGLKQIAPLGPKGEIILDYSVYDAVHAGFDKVVIIIKKAIEKDFREAAGRRIEKMVDVSYAYQELDRLPQGFSVPEGRVKPWGTAHAILCARDLVQTPFAVINADDFYGRHSYELIHSHLVSSQDMAMVGYRLGNTLTENGTVSRGICEINDGYLKSVTEYTALDRNSGIPLDTTVSMNLWGLQQSIFDALDHDFRSFLSHLENPLKGECYLPFVIDRMIKEENQRVRVLTTDERWYGVTYPDDAQTVRDAISKMTQEGVYHGI